MEKWAQSMLRLQFAQRGSQLETLDVLFTSFTWLSCVMMDRVFSLLSAAFFGLLFGVEALCFRSAN